MSKYDYKKELKDSLIDACYLTVGIFSIAWAGSKVGISKPTFSVTPENIGKIGTYLTAADMIYSSLKHYKILPWM